MAFKRKCGILLETKYSLTKGYKKSVAKKDEKASYYEAKKKSIIRECDECNRPLGHGMDRHCSHECFNRWLIRTDDDVGDEGEWLMWVDGDLCLVRAENDLSGEDEHERGTHKLVKKDDNLSTLSGETEDDIIGENRLIRIGSSMVKSVVDIGKDAVDVTKSAYLELEKRVEDVIEDEVSKKIGNDTVDFANRTYLGLGKRVEDVIEDGVSVLTGSTRTYSWDDTLNEEDEQKGDAKGSYDTWAKRVEDVIEDGVSVLMDATRAYSWDDTWNEEDEKKGDAKGPYSLDETWDEEDEQQGDLEGYRGKEGGLAPPRPGRRRWHAFLLYVGKARRFKWGRAKSLST